MGCRENESALFWCLANALVALGVYRSFIKINNNVNLNAFDRYAPYPPYPLVIPSCTHLSL